MTAALMPEAEVRRPFDHWPDIASVDPPDRRTIAAIAGIAVLADAALRGGFVGVAGAALIIAAAGALVASPSFVNRRALALVAGAGAFGAMLLVRSDPWLIAMDVVAAGFLLMIGASMAKSGDPWNTSFVALGARAFYAFLHTALAPAYPFRRKAAASHQEGVPATTSWSGLLRGLAIAAPIVLVVGLLFASADAVFASFFTFGLDVDAGDLFLHAVLLTVGAWGASSLLRLAAGDPLLVLPPGRKVLGTTEAVTVLVSLATLLGVFAVAQVVAAVRGAAYVIDTAGLTYAEYARRGFFQLLAVAAIALVVLVTIHAATRSAVDTRSPAAVTVLAHGVTGLTLVVVGVAIRRLFLYEAAYGLTRLRLWSVVFAIWLGVVFALLALLIAGIGRGRHWFAPASITAWLALLLAANIVNVDAMIVRRNAERFGPIERVDAAYLVTLPDDAVPALVEALGDLSADDAAYVRDATCGEDGRSPGLLRWTVSSARASAARAELCR